MFADVVRLLRSARIVVFLVCCVAIGALNAIVRNFLFWHLEELSDREGGSDGGADRVKTLQGLATVVQTFGGEVPLMFAAGPLLHRIGEVHAFSVVLAAFGVRLLAYAWLRSAWWTLPIELLHGPTFGLYLTTMTTYAARVAPPGAATTVQAVAGALYEGVGFSLGGAGGGWAMQRWGGSRMFGWLGAGAVVACGVHVAVQALMDRWGCERVERGAGAVAGTKVDAVVVVAEGVECTKF